MLVIVARIDKILSNAMQTRNLHIIMAIIGIEIIFNRVYFKITVCPRSLDPFRMASYYLKWVKTSLPKKYNDIKFIYLNSRKSNLFDVYDM